MTELSVNACDFCDQWALTKLVVPDCNGNRYACGKHEDQLRPGTDLDANADVR